MGRSFHPTVTTHPTIAVSLPKLGMPHPSLGSQRPQAQPIHPLKISAAPPASIFAGGSSLGFLSQHSLPCAAAKGPFLKGKADLVCALPKFYCTKCNRQSYGGISSKCKSQLN